ncbi:MAG: hypothetical protein ABI658_14870 [Acidimicrobiales bacterium]
MTDLFDFDRDDAHSAERWLDRVREVCDWPEFAGASIRYDADFDVWVLAGVDDERLALFWFQVDHTETWPANVGPVFRLDYDDDRWFLDVLIRNLECDDGECPCRVK